jgi:hypothetical protein
MHARPCYGSERRWLRRAVAVTRIGGAGPLTDPGKTLTKSRQAAAMSTVTPFGTTWEAFVVAEILAALNAVSRPEIRHKAMARREPYDRRPRG